MRLILQDCMKREISARQKFFYETFHLWLVVNSINNHYIQLTSIPSNCISILFIVGHNTFVKNYLKHTKIEEEKIIEEVKAEAPPSKEELLLAEIRDLLKEDKTQK